MAAIDLLFRTHLESERIHQVALTALLRHTNLADLLIPGFGPASKVLWEPRGGTYDLGITNAASRTVMIELKIDTSLVDGQINGHVNGLKRTEELAYVLLGHARITARPRLDRTLAEPSVLQPWIVRDIRDLRDALAHVKVTAGLPESAEVQELATAYRAHLAALESRTDGFFDCPVSQWGEGEHWALYYGFFDHCRRMIPSMKDAGIDHVPTPNGGFFACYWSWTLVEPDVEAYLQFQDDSLCFKIMVEDGVDRSATRDRIRTRLHGLSEAIHLPIRRPHRLGSGQTMTLAVLDAEHTHIGSKDRWDSFVAILGKAEQVIQSLAQPSA